MPHWLIYTVVALAVLSAVVPQVLRYVASRRVPKVCRTCKLWDHESGQAAMAQHGDFMAAAAVLAPSQMATRVRYESNPDGTLKENPDGSLVRHEDRPNIAMKAKWSEFGLCECPCPVHESSVIMHRDDKCDHWTSRPRGQA
jgi:hypothetical protein